MNTQSITPESLKSNNEFLCGLELPEIQVYLIYQGTDRVKYYAFRYGAILFEGNDFKPSPMHNIDAIDSCVELLSFLTLQVGDTDLDYFDNYTEAQMVWTTTIDCEQVELIISDFKDKDSEYFTETNEKLNAAFITA